MERIITLKGRMGRYDVPSFLYADNDELVIRFVTQNCTIGKYIAVVSCGKLKQALYLDKEMKIRIDCDFIKRGNFQPLCISLELRTMQGDKIIIPADPTQGGYLIEPLYIERANNNTIAIAWLQKVEARLNEYYEMLTAFGEKLSQFEDEGVPLIAEQE